MRPFACLAKLHHHSQRHRNNPDGDFGYPSCDDAAGRGRPNETHWHGRWDPEQRRFDIAIRGVFPQEQAHGVIGQSYRDGTIRSGKVDEYGATSTPGLVNGMGVAPPMTTSAQAEGAIDGTYLDYRLSSPFETYFKYSRYRASPSPAVSGGGRSGRFFRTASTSEWK